MNCQKVTLLIGLIVLLAFLAVPGSAADSSAKPGYITVGIGPVAQFDAYYAFSTVPTKVMFVDSSLGSTPMTYEWDFGDGGTSTEQNPTHMYIQRGLYTVTLKIKNDYGASTAIKKNYIAIGMAPNADFVASPTSGTVPATVQFTDKSTGQVTSWSWDFGDGTRSTEQNPAHTYWTAGSYNIILTVMNDYGQDDATKTSYINIAGGLKSKFTATPGSGSAPLTVQFRDASSGSPTAWAWDFDDGTTSAEQNPIHTFAKEGAYDVNLTVTRGTDSDSSKQTIDVGGVPVADFAATPLAANPGDAIAFTDKSSNNPTTWSWDFGDTGTSAYQNPSHTYQVKGIYTVTLTAKNSNGKDTETKLNYINIGIRPKADFRTVIPSYQLNQVPLNAHFVDMSTGNPTSWSWDFGDGGSSTDQNPAHMYMSAGTYTVTLTVKNSFGSDTVIKKDIVTVGKGAAVDFTADRTVVGVGRIVTFTDLSANNPTMWEWQFGDGVIGTGPNPSHIYQKTGVYDVTLTASNPDNSNSRTKNAYITVLNLPVADFTTDKSRGGAPMTVTFTDQTTGNPTKWSWDFGDGATSTEKNPAHTYTTLGTYTVSLTASNENGQDTATKKGLIVTTLAPVADFKADRQVGKAPFVVKFTDISTGSPTKWSWDFGDGTTSSEQNPQHIYMYEGSYDVKLTASNQYGSDTMFKTGTSSTKVVAVATAATASQAAPSAASAAAPAAAETTASAAAAPTAATPAPLSPVVTVAALALACCALSVILRR